ncbi:MAG TPA: FAD-dependent oxidoreductase [Bacilli bacterium]|nr:FAD-dependent oxidoreductase [Bacilli bacterium]
MNKVDLLVIGGGSAGLAAAIGAYDAGVKDILILEKDRFLGGILNQCIHPGFGLTEFKEQLTGPEYAERFINEVERRGIRYELDTMVITMTPDKQVTYSNAKQGLVKVKATTVVLATGCYERNAGSIALPGDRPSGVITAGLAQRYLNIDGYLVGKRVFILGSGDIGLIMARRMTLEGAKVLGVAEIMPYSNGLNRNIVQCLVDYDIPLYLSHTVTRIIGKRKLEKIIISQVDEKFMPIPGTELEFTVDTLLLSVGLIPSNELLDKLGVPTDKTRGAIVDQNLQTAIPGVYSCGNVLHVHDLVDFVSAEGKIAGKMAAKFINEPILDIENQIKVIPQNGISYVVPQRVDVNRIYGTIEFKFRVSKPRTNVFFVISQADTILKRAFHQVAIPSEMINIVLPMTTKIDPSIAITVAIKERQ